MFMQTGNVETYLLLKQTEYDEIENAKTENVHDE